MNCSTPPGSHFYQSLVIRLPPAACSTFSAAPAATEGAAVSRFSPAGLPSNLKLKTSNSAERGVALIITLIFLAIITFMAVTFLVLSRHASEAVTTVTQQAISQQAAQSAVEQAEANIVATMTAKGEGFSFGPMISQNYQSFAFTNGVANPANVNYFDTAGNPLDYRSTAYLQMLNNMLVKPRPPVVITTNANFPPDFRYYLDLNQNGVFDASELTPITDQFGVAQPNAAGDPEWIGILEHPDQPHSRSNLFVARYCFFAQPIGNSLDINNIHNQAKKLARPDLDGFLRNEGVGSWEINLAGFLNGIESDLLGLHHLRLCQRECPRHPTNASAFDDAAALLQYRYGGYYGNLNSFAQLYPFTPNVFPVEGIDGFSAGPLLTGPFLPGALNLTNFPWSGANNLNNFFTTQDIFTAPNSQFVAANLFTTRLASAGQGLPAANPNFHRYTYYRMLSQMGMDSAPEPTTK